MIINTETQIWQFSALKLKHLLPNIMSFIKLVPSSLRHLCHRGGGTSVATRVDAWFKGNTVFHTELDWYIHIWAHRHYSTTHELVWTRENTGKGKHIDVKVDRCPLLKKIPAIDSFFSKGKVSILVFLMNFFNLLKTFLFILLIILYKYWILFPYFIHHFFLYGNWSFKNKMRLGIVFVIAWLSQCVCEKLWSWWKVVVHLLFDVLLLCNKSHCEF